MDDFYTYRATNPMGSIVRNPVNPPDYCPSCGKDLRGASAITVYPHWPNWPLVLQDLAEAVNDCCKTAISSSPDGSVERVYADADPKTVPPTHGYIQADAYQMITVPIVGTQVFARKKARRRQDTRYREGIHDMLIEINEEKERLTPFANKKGYKSVSEILRPIDIDVRELVVERLRDTRISRAWIKGYEIFAGIPGLLPDHCYDENRVFAFFAAEAPGSMILALEHWTNHEGLRYQWLANTKESSKKDPGFIGDTYKLIAKNKAKWLHKRGAHDGDLLVHHELIAEQVLAEPLAKDDEALYGDAPAKSTRENIGVSVYVGDGSIGIEKKKSGGLDYDRQTDYNTPIIIREMSLARRVQRVGGSAIIKMYGRGSIADPTIDALYVTEIARMHASYTAVYIVKTKMSRAKSDEVYLVCTGFIADVTDVSPDDTSAALEGIHESYAKIGRVQLETLRDHYEVRARYLGKNPSASVKHIKTIEKPRLDASKKLGERFVEYLLGEIDD